jgi:hypothetical protein
MNPPDATSLLSPELDLLIESVGRGAEGTSRELLEQVRGLIALLGKIEPMVYGPDLLWSFWIRTERGRLEDFADETEFLEAGEVESREELGNLWRLEYPDELQWWRLGIQHYQNRLFFRLSGKLAFDVELESAKFSGIDVARSGRLVLWLMGSAGAEILRFVSDPEAYNRELGHSLPLCKRFGRIRRRDLWEASEEVARFDEELGEKALERFGEIVRKMDVVATVKEMTLADYLRFCRICYQANGYEQLEPSMTPREMYRAMADNRDAGLLEIPPDDPSAFSRWYRDRQLGAHPWEICRGGNRTHISLQVTPRGDGWQLFLAGFSMARAIETAKMAIALDESGVPFVLERREEMLSMLRGEDLLGIVPEDIPLGYNHSDFPEEDKIHSFIRLAVIEETCGSLPDSIAWYPLKKLSPASSFL